MDLSPTSKARGRERAAQTEIKLWGEVIRANHITGG